MWVDVSFDCLRPVKQGASETIGAAIVVATGGKRPKHLHMASNISNFQLLF